MGNRHANRRGNPGHRRRRSTTARSEPSSSSGLCVFKERGAGAWDRTVELVSGAPVAQPKPRDADPQRAGHKSTARQRGLVDRGPMTYDDTIGLGQTLSAVITDCAGAAGPFPTWGVAAPIVVALPESCRCRVISATVRSEQSSSSGLCVFKERGAGAWARAVELVSGAPVVDLELRDAQPQRAGHKSTATPRGLLRRCLTTYDDTIGRGQNLSAVLTHCASVAAASPT
jgi:hypothetical protein